MRETTSRENLFDLDSLAKSHWRSRINQFKRELRASQGRPVVTSVGPRRRFSPKRQPGRPIAQSLP